MKKILVSHGEILDKVSILIIKNQKINDKTKLLNVKKELKILQTVFQSIVNNNQNIQNLYNQLIEINTKLWDTEDDIRAKEKEQVFDNEFIKLARSVYMLNDKRAKIKKEINTISGSELIEEKSYIEY
jgi:Asp-tRNA(Asn)/Glu-tRNA(Gln) amidotransferase C subunit